MIIAGGEEDGTTADAAGYYLQAKKIMIELFRLPQVADVQIDVANISLRRYVWRNQFGISSNGKVVESRRVLAMGRGVLVFGENQQSRRVAGCRKRSFRSVALNNLKADDAFIKFACTGKISRPQLNATDAGTVRQSKRFHV